MQGGMNSGIDGFVSSSGVAFGSFRMCHCEAALFLPSPWRATLGPFILLWSFRQGSRSCLVSPRLLNEALFVPVRVKYEILSSRLAY